MDVLPGQLITGRQELSLQVGLSEQSIRTALTKLKSTNELTIKTTKHYSLITVVKWDEYQDNQPTDQPPTNQLANQQLTTTKERKKEKKESIFKPDSVSESVWIDFLELRKKKNAPVTQTVIDGINKQAVIASITLEAALTECCVRGWQSFKADWYTKPKQEKSSQQRARL